MQQESESAVPGIDAPLNKPLQTFTGYQKFVIAVLAFLQFTIILDFMIISPLGAILMPALKITPAQFGTVVSAYAFSAGVSGILAAGFADRFDRKRLLLFFYTGFLGGTLFCGLATNFEFLLIARMVTGIFGGVIGSVVMAVTTDLFPMEMRGRVMGFIQTAFSASQVMGIPAGIYFSNLWGWHAPFFLIVGVGAVVGVVIAFRLRPVREHLKVKNERNPVMHLLHTVINPQYTVAFALTALLSTGGFMLMPFGSAFTVNNLKISMHDLPLIYLTTGIVSIFMGPLIGRLADKHGKFPVFVIGSIISACMVIFYTHLGPTPLIGVMVVNMILFTGIFSRMIPAQALMSGVPSLSNRGAFMAVGSSCQQVSGGLAALLAGLLVVENADGSLGHFERIGWVVVGTSFLTVLMMYHIVQFLDKKARAGVPSGTTGP